MPAINDKLHKRFKVVKNINHDYHKETLQALKNNCVTDLPLL